MNACSAAVRDRRGFSLGLVLFAVVLLSSLALTMSTLTLATRTETVRDLDVDRAAYIARAGFERTCAEALLSSDDWSTVDADPFGTVDFGAGQYRVSLIDRAPDSTRVEVVAALSTGERRLRFRAHRIQYEGITTGVRLVGIEDPTLDVLTR